MARKTRWFNIIGGQQSCCRRRAARMRSNLRGWPWDGKNVGPQFSPKSKRKPLEIASTRIGLSDGSILKSPKLWKERLIQHSSSRVSDTSCGRVSKLPTCKKNMFLPNGLRPPKRYPTVAWPDEHSSEKSERHQVRRTHGWNYASRCRARWKHERNLNDIAACHGETLLRSGGLQWWQEKRIHAIPTPQVRHHRPQYGH